MLGANLAVPLQDAPRFLDACRGWATRTIVWVVPAQQGTARLCPADGPPPRLRGEADQRPGLDRVLAVLGPSAQPDRVVRAPWTFRAAFPDRGAAYHPLREALGWRRDHPRREALRAHVLAAAEPLPDGGIEMATPKLSAVLVWNVT